MPINEFDQSVRPEYVSNRIQLPFAEIHAMAANQQKSFNEGKALEDDLGALGQAIKAAPMYEGHRQAFINEYKTKIKDLTGNGNINYADPEFKRKASMLVNEFKSRPEINAFSNTLKSFQDWESQVKNPDNAMNLDFTYDKDKQGNFNQLDVNKQGIYSPKFTKFEDYNETGKKIMGHIASDGSLKDSGYDFSNPANIKINNGETQVYNSNTHGWEGVSSGKLGNLSKMMVGEYVNTVAGKHHLQSLIGKDITYNQLDDNTKSKVNNIFANHLYASNANQVGGKTTDKLDYHFEKDRNAEGKNDNKKIAETLIPSTIEGNTFDATRGDGGFNNLINNGTFNINENGISFDPNSLTKPSNTFDVRYSDGTVKNVKTYAEAQNIYNNTPGVQINPSDKKVSSEEKVKQFTTQVDKMSKALGVKYNDLLSNGKIDYAKVNQLATSYNELTKSRSLDLNLAPAVQESETENANLNWYNVKQVDPNNPTTTIENTQLGENEHVVVVNRRTDETGKMYNEGYIENTKTKEVKPIAFRSQSKDKNLVFDALGKIQKIGIDNLSNDRPNYLKGSSGKDITISMNNTNYKLAGEENIGKGYYVQLLTDPNNKSNTIYVMKNNNNEVVDMKQSLGDLKKSVETFYFTEIPEGITELENIKGKTKQAENQQNAR